MRERNNDSRRFLVQATSGVIPMQGEDMSEAAQPIETEESRNANQLPEPKGYKILIALPDPDSEYSRRRAWIYLWHGS